MNRYKILTIVFVTLFTTPIAALAFNEDLKVIKERIIESNFRAEHDSKKILNVVKKDFRDADSPDVITETQRKDKSDAVIVDYVSSLNADGSWSDINYDDKRRSSWSPTIHVQRMLIMAGGYSNPMSDFYHKETLRTAVLSALDCWFDKKLVCLNWWYNQIGVPQILGPTLLIMQDHLSARQLKEGVTYMKNAKISMTGQNKVWLAYNVLMTAILENDVKSATTAIDAIKEEIVVSLGEGIQPDWSFHQHGAQPQFGNYGLAYITTMTQFGRILSGTRYAFSGNQVDILRNLIVDGTSKVVWMQYFDVSSCGRQLFKSSLRAKAIAYGKTLIDMMYIDRDNIDIYERIYKHNILQKHDDILNGYKHFYRSDFSVFRNNKWFASMKMSSERVIAAEFVNDENLRGYNLSDGALMLYRDGDEYADIFPVWQWQLIPGVTTRYDNGGQFETVTGGYRLITNKNKQAGGVSSKDGKYGLSAMNIDKKDLKANKSWFFCDDYILCLASGITSNESQVCTSVNQTLLKGNVKKNMVNGMVSYTHNNIRYTMSDTLDVVLKEWVQQGRWNDIVKSYLDTTFLYKDVFNMYIDHGKSPKGSSYAYTIEPDASVMSKRKLADVNIIECSSNIHAVRCSDNLYYVAFFDAATVCLGEINLTSISPCVVLLIRNSNGEYDMEYSSTTLDSDMLDVKIERLSFRSDV